METIMMDTDQDIQKIIFENLTERDNNILRILPFAVCLFPFVLYIFKP